MKYAAIADWAANSEYTVTFMCAQLGVARSGYYRWLAQGPSRRERDDADAQPLPSASRPRGRDTRTATMSVR